MPIHLDERDVVSEVEGLHSALIVACTMCAGASFATKENQPFIQFFRSGLKSPPLERYIGKLRARLNHKGIKTKKFKGGIIQQFFLCLWTSRQRNEFHESAKKHDAVIVLGCDSAFKTARHSVKGTNCKVIEGMKVAGIMNTKTRFRLPFDILFEETGMVSMCDRHCLRSARESKSLKEVIVSKRQRRVPAGKPAVFG